MRVAVVGHVEWIELAHVEHVPRPGEIVHASGSSQLPAGGGAVAAVQLAKLAGECLFLTALGDDEVGRRSKRELERLGLRVEVAWRAEPQRRGFVHLDAAGERTITVLGERLGPHGDDPVPWGELAEADAVYLTAGDPAAVRAARAARTLVVSARARNAVAPARVRLDALVASARDPGERYAAGDLDPPPDLVVRTSGAEGGRFETAAGEVSSWVTGPLPGPFVDAYGAGDSFAGGLTYGLGLGLAPGDALALAARCGAAAVTGTGPYEAQLSDPG